MKKIVVVGGGGHVGLPFSLVLASRGFTVTALDISEETVTKINSGQMPFQESGASELLVKTLAEGSFFAATDPSVVSSAEAVIIVIGTPVDEHLNPDPNAVGVAIKECIPFMNSSQLVILRSTVFPGVTRRVRELFLSVGLDPEVTFCPERILEGHAIKELTELPQIIGSWTKEGYTRSSLIFEKLGVKCISVSPEEAELAKLFTNVWRYIKFAAANQFWLMSNQAGLDYSRIRSAIITDYPRASDLPGAGFSAGPCLFKDTMQLAAFSNNNFALGHSAMQVNESIPLYIISELEKKYELNKLTIGILGAAFKGDSDDIRSSLAYKLKKALEFKAKDVMMTDPHVTVDKTLSDLESTITKSDILIIASPHSEYRNLETDKPVVDIWDLLGSGSLIP
jgi:UDP-N-acetyl-D-mannosaminuronic acid dehydrogenase